jgi:predicted PurR-regulated permease PerM
MSEPRPASTPGASTPPISAGSWGPRRILARGQLFAFFFFAVFLFLLYQLYLLLVPFLGAIVWAAILALLFYPLYARVLRSVGGRASLAASIMTLLVTTTIVGPTVSLSSVVTRQAIGLYQQTSEAVRSGRLRESVERLRASRLGRLADRVGQLGLELDYGAIVQRVADVISANATAFARNVAAFLFNLAVMLFTLFFFLRDGERMYRGLNALIPMDPVHKDQIFLRLYETLSAVVRGMLTTALAQGVLTGVGLTLLGMPFAAFLGVLAGVCSLIPFAGAALVWIPCTLYFAATGDVVRALVLLAYGGLVISMVDNVLRPLLIGGRTSLHTLFLFFGILGGVQVYGVLGLFLGPVLLAIVVAFVTIYREQYAAPEAAAPPAGAPL